MTRDEEIYLCRTPSRRDMPSGVAELVTVLLGILYGILPSPVAFADGLTLSDIVVVATNDRSSDDV